VVGSDQASDFLTADLADGADVDLSWGGARRPDALDFSVVGNWDLVVGSDQASDFLTADHADGADLF